MNCIGSSATSTVNNGAIIPSPPDAPISGTCGARSINSVTFSWLDGANVNGGPITEYRITSQPLGNTDPAQITTTTVSSVANNFEFLNKRYTLNTLTNGQTYQITIASRNAAGFSAESIAFNCLACVNPPQPTSLSYNLAYISSTGLRLNWVAGANNFAHSVTYIVTASYLDANNIRQQSQVSSIVGTSHDLVNLITGREYTVSVRATNPCGDSAESSSIVVTVGSAPSAVLNVAT
jgi:hypothetical protein